MKRYIIYIFSLLIFSVCFSSGSMAQEIQAEARLDKLPVLMGDQTVLHLSVHVPAGESIAFPQLTDTITSGIRIVSFGKTDTVTAGDRSQTITRNIIITSFDPGYYTIPPFSISTKNGTVKTNAVSLRVLPVKVDTTKAIYDIKQPLAVTYSWLDWLRDHWLWIVIPLLAVLLAAGIIYYIKKRSKKAPVPRAEKKVVVPPHTIALEKLKELRERKLWQNDQVKQYHSELTDIIREYLEKRYGIKALEQTTEDIFSGLKRMDISDGNRDLLHQMFVLADLAKFAKQKPSAAENEMSMEIAINFVEGTRKAEAAPEIKEERMNDEHV